MIVIAATMMVIEIAAGSVYGSMALVANGWHMSTHAAAMLIAALAYMFARKNSRNPGFTFGTGKLGDLAAFGSAVVLALIGLDVNLLCAWLLRDDHTHTTTDMTTITPTIMTTTAMGTIIPLPPTIISVLLIFTSLRTL